MVRFGVPVTRRLRAAGHRHAGRGMLLLTTAAISILLATPAVAPGQPTTAGDTFAGSWAARIAATDGARPTASLTRTLPAGSSTIHTVEVFNLGADPRTFEVLVEPARDATPGTGPNDVTTWLTPEVDQLALPARGNGRVEVLLDIPPTARLGEHRAAIIVTPVPGTSGASLAARGRVALTVRLQVAGEVLRGTELGELSWGRHRRTVTFQLPVTNTGNTDIEAGGRLTLERRGGTLRELDLGTGQLVLEPDATGTLVARLHPAPWFARLTATPEVTTTLTGGSPLTIVGEPVTVWLVPWVQLLTALGVAVLAPTLWVATRDGRTRWLADRRADRAVLAQARADRQRTRAQPHHPVDDGWVFVPDPGGQEHEPTVSDEPRGPEPATVGGDAPDVQVIDVTDEVVDVRDEAVDVPTRGSDPEPRPGASSRH